MSNRRIGVGCDQLMIIENTSIKENFKVKMYNSDGSETGACGNGVRCIADYLMKKEIAHFSKKACVQKTFKKSILSQTNIIMYLRNKTRKYVS